MHSSRRPLPRRATTRRLELDRLRATAAARLAAAALALAPNWAAAQTVGSLADGIDARASRAGSYSVQSQGGSLSGIVHELDRAVTSFETCQSVRPTARQLEGLDAAGIDKTRRVITRIRSNPALLGRMELAPDLNALKDLWRRLVSRCEALPTAQQAGPRGDAGRAIEISAMMRTQFLGGDLSPTSRAVVHAMTVDMPARGGTVESLKRYLSDAQVRRWYCANFALRCPG